MDEIEFLKKEEAYLILKQKAEGLNSHEEHWLAYIREKLTELEEP